MNFFFLWMSGSVAHVVRSCDICVRSSPGIFTIMILGFASLSRALAASGAGTASHL